MLTVRQGITHGIDEPVDGLMTTRSRRRQCCIVHEQRGLGVSEEEGDLGLDICRIQGNVDGTGTERGEIERHRPDRLRHLYDDAVSRPDTEFGEDRHHTSGKLVDLAERRAAPIGVDKEVPLECGRVSSP